MNKENRNIANKCIVKFFLGFAFKYYLETLWRRIIYIATSFYTFTQLWKMHQSSTSKKVRILSMNKFILFLLHLVFWIFDFVFFPITNLKVLYAIITSFFSIYLMLVFCFTITNLKLGYLQARISHRCSLIGLALLILFFIKKIHLVVDVHCHHLWMSKQIIINLLIWIIIKSCDA